MTSLSFPPVPTPGARNSLTDVAGLRVGHATQVGDGWLSGTTVVLAPSGGAVAGVDVRGGGPGTRETDLLDPRNAVDRVHAIVLSGGSAFGLSAAHGVVQRLLAAGEGVRVGPARDIVVPIVPGAVVFDLGRGGDVSCTPGPEHGASAYDAASDAIVEGTVGAGTGAVAGALKGGVGSASAVLSDGSTVGALAVVNAAGSAVDPDTGELYAARFALPGDLPSLRPPDPAELQSFLADATRDPAAPMLHTTIGVVGCDVTLTKAQCSKVAGIAHDGLARGIRPVHTMFDGDTVFALATGERDAPDMLAFHELLAAAADCFTRAIARAMVAATGVQTPGGTWAGYLEALPSAAA